jgi:hypothetical protein
MFDNGSQFRDWIELAKAIDESETIPGCTNYPDAFFPEGNAALDPFVKWSCQTCPVQALCLQYGVKWEDHGVWGGLDLRKRRSLERRLKRVA